MEHEIVIMAVQCPECGVHFGIDKGLFEMAKRTKKRLYCTNGHSMHAVQDNNEVLRLSRIIEQQEAQLEQLQTELREIKERTLNGAITIGCLQWPSPENFNRSQDVIQSNSIKDPDSSH